MNNLIYKIRSTATGLYSVGGYTPKFNKKGKVWKELSHLHSHLAQLDANGRAMYKRNAVEIVTFEIQEVQKASVSYEDKMNEIKQRQDEKQELIRLKTVEANKQALSLSYKHLTQELD